MTAFHFDTRRHRYTLDGQRVLGVTTILNAVPKQDFLKPWAARMVAEYAYDHRDAWKDLPRPAAVDMLKREPLRFTGAAAARGTAVHAAINQYVLGYDAPDDLTDEQWGYFNAALSYLGDHSVTIERTETSVYSRTYGYAGTFDAFQRRGDGPLEIADFKTGKSLYEEYALQLAGYARADFIGDPETGQELPVPEIRRGVLIRLGSDGAYEIAEVEITDELFAAFLAVQQVHGWVNGPSSLLAA